VSLEVMLRGVLRPARLLDLVENFTLFSEHKAGLVKIIGQNHQFLGVNNAIAAMLARASRARSRRRVLADAGQRQELLAWCSSPRRSCARFPATGPSWW
jgi:hypothetical protein